MERMRSRTKSMLDARKSIVLMEKSTTEKSYKPEPIDPMLAAGGLAPCPAARTKIAMLPTSSGLQSSEGALSSIFASHRIPTPQEQSMMPMYGRRSVTSLGNATDPSGHPPRSSSAMDGSSTPPWLSNQGASPHTQPKYKQHNVSEYKKIMTDFQQIKWGGLGANDNEEKQRAREARKKVLQYGNCVSNLNVQVAMQNQIDVQLERSPQRRTQAPPQPPGSFTLDPIPRKLTKEGEVAKLKRERAMEFANQLWVKEGRTPHPQQEVATSSNTPARNRPSKNQAVGMSQQHIVQELHVLEDRHREDFEKILAIKKQLGILVVQQTSPSSSTNVAAQHPAPPTGKVSQQPEDAHGSNDDNVPTSSHNSSSSSSATRLRSLVADHSQSVDDAVRGLNGTDTIIVHRHSSPNDLEQHDPIDAGRSSVSSHHSSVVVAGSSSAVDTDPMTVALDVDDETRTAMSQEREHHPVGEVCRSEVEESSSSPASHNRSVTHTREPNYSASSPVQPNHQQHQSTNDEVDVVDVVAWDAQKQRGTSLHSSPHQQETTTPTQGQDDRDDSSNLDTCHSVTVAVPSGVVTSTSSPLRASKSMPVFQQPSVEGHPHTKPRAEDDTSVRRQSRSGTVDHVAMNNAALTVPPPPANASEGERSAYGLSLLMDLGQDLSLLELTSPTKA